MNGCQQCAPGYPKPSASGRGVSHSHPGRPAPGQFVVVVGPQFGARAHFGPFDSREQAERWARHPDRTHGAYRIWPLFGGVLLDDDDEPRHVGHFSRLGGTWWCDTCSSPYCELA